MNYSVAAMLLCAALSLAGCATLPAQDHGAQTNEEAHDGQRRPPPTALAVGDPKPKNEQPQSAGQPQTLVGWLYSNGPADYSLVLIGAITAYLAVRSLRAIETQVAEQVKATKAAERSARTAERTMYLSLRARLGVSEITAVTLTDDLIHCKLYFENFGGKAAMVRDYWYRFVRSREEGLEAPPVGSSEWRAIRLPVHASQRVGLDLFAGDVEAGFMKRVQNGDSILIVRGGFRYNAGFGKGIKTMNFGHEYDHTVHQMTGKHTFSAVAGYNDAD